MLNCRLVILPLVLVLAAIGCGDKKTNAAKLSGKISYKGAPVTAGTITIYGPEGGANQISIGTDGSYGSGELPVGTCKVTIETESANPKGKTAPADYGTRGKKQGTGGAKEKEVPAGMTPGAGGMSPRPAGANSGETGAYVEIPKKYADKEKSGLSVTLTKGDQTKNFDLTE